MSICKITLFDTPRPLVLEDLEGSALDVFFATGIVNPFGPTLTVVAAAGTPSEGIELPIVHIMLNPFTQSVVQIGKLFIGSEWNPVDLLSPIIEQNYGSCPTIVLISNQVSEKVRLALAAQIFDTYGDEVNQVFQSINKHFGDPWTRVSEAMQDTTYEPDDRSIAALSRDLAALVLSPEHFKPEFQAFAAAWHGSIESIGISDQMKFSAMSSEKFMGFFIERILPAIWIPEIKEEISPPPAVIKPEKLEINSLEDMTHILESGEWQTYSEEKLVDLMRSVLFVYGNQGDTQYIKWLSGLYKQLLSLGVDEDTRLMLESEMVSLVENGKVLPLVFLPFLVQDPSRQVASKAVIDFVSMSDYVNGELYAFTELRHFFQNRILANRGAVFGGLIAMGDRQSVEFAAGFRDQLDSEEVQAAARVHTPFPQHKAIQFWLQWAKELVLSQRDEDQRNFGSAASALILTLNHNAAGQISDGDRNYPCHKSDNPIDLTQVWNKEDYAREIAKDLYWVESQEDAPSLFSDVLRIWGLMLQAPVEKQFMSNRASENRRLENLGSSPGPSDGKGFLARLFGGKGK